MFAGLKAAWDSMTSEERQKKIAALKAVTTLKSFCEAKGYVLCDVNKLTIEIYWRTKEVEELLDALKAAGLSKMKVVRKIRKKW